MFDDEKAPGQAPSNLPFAPDTHTPSTPGSVSAPHTPDALDAGLLKKKGEGIGDASTPPLGAAPSPFTAPLPPPQPMAAMTYATKEPVLGKVLAGILSVIAVGAVGVGGWYGYSRIVRPMLDGTKTVTEQSTSTVSNSSAATTTTATSTPQVYRPQASSSSIQAQTNNDTILFGEQTDSDRDGLPDRRERELGTDPDKADSDSDALSDGDEILIWGTDPLNQDSDGDGYKDGSEIKNGYSPLGPGKLFDGATSTASVSGTAKNSTSTSASSSTTATSSSNNVPSL